MCGILVSAGINRPFHHRLLRGLARRGPDAIGFWTDGVVQMAQTRLAVIGLDERGNGPLENSSHVLAYNGEIYNFHELKVRVKDAGLPIEGANDAEILLQAWSLWGREILEDLVGFWAFVIYDKKRQTLTLVRDQMGVKPLYYWRSRNKLCVASQMGTLLESIDESPELDYTALSEYARYQFTFGDKTFFKQIKKVPPGHQVEFDLSNDKTCLSRYEDIFASPPEFETPLTSKWLEETRELLFHCVLDSTISDTPFTTFCSGGLESSLITRIASPEVTYHANFSDPECNETFYAQQVVKDTPIRLFVVNAQESFDLVSRLRDLINDFDEITVGSVILPLDDLLSEVKRRYKVVLTGTGGDELFGGYVRYQLAMGECYQTSYRTLYQKMRSVSTMPERFEMTHCKGNPNLYAFYQSEVQKTFLEEVENCFVHGDPIEAMLRFDRRHFLPALINIDDKMCGRHSLESRPSFLHQKFVRHLQGIPPRAFLDRRVLKPLLRELSEDCLPQAVLRRTDKMGFTTPIGAFVNQSSHLIREQILNSPFRHLYDLKKLNFTAETKFSRETFGLLMLDLWLNRYAVPSSTKLPEESLANVRTV